MASNALQYLVFNVLPMFSEKKKSTHLVAPLTSGDFAACRNIIVKELAKVMLTALTIC